MNKPVLAVLTSRFPYPIDKGDKLRLYHQLRDLSKQFQVHLFALHEKPIEAEHFAAIEPYCTQIKTYALGKMHWPQQALRCLWQNLPLQSGYFFSPTLKKQIQHDLQAIKPDAIYVQLSRMMPYTEGLSFPLVLDLQDCFSLNYTRAAKQSTGLRALFYAREARTVQGLETQLLQSPIHTTIISNFDREALPVQPNNTRVVPNGVDTFFFQPLQGEKPYTIVYVGNLSYQPNQEAARFLCEVLMPKLVQRIPSAKLLLAGANMPSFMKQWESNHIHCAGWMKDIRTAYASAQLFVAPLFSGAGVQNKMLEAMSMGMPCITTPLVNASLNAPVPNTVLTANDADGFCSAIEKILKNSEQAQAMGQAGRTWVETNYRWTTANATLIAVIQNAIAK